MGQPGQLRQPEHRPARTSDHQTPACRRRTGAAASSVSSALHGSGTQCRSGSIDHRPASAAATAGRRPGSPARPRSPPAGRSGSSSRPTTSAQPARKIFGTPSASSTQPALRIAGDLLDQLQFVAGVQPAEVRAHRLDLHPGHRLGRGDQHVRRAAGGQLDDQVVDRVARASARRRPRPGCPRRRYPARSPPPRGCPVCPAAPPGAGTTPHHALSSTDPPRSRRRPAALSCGAADAARGHTPDDDSVRRKVVGRNPPEGGRRALRCRTGHRGRVRAGSATASRSRTTRPVRAGRPRARTCRTRPRLDRSTIAPLPAPAGLPVGSTAAGRPPTWASGGRVECA